MPATTIFELLVAIFSCICIVGILIGLYSVVAHSEGMGKTAMWLFAGGGIAAIICSIIRITLAFGKFFRGIA